MREREAKRLRCFNQRHFARRHVRGHLQRGRRQLPGWVAPKPRRGRDRDRALRHRRTPRKVRLTSSPGVIRMMAVFPVAGPPLASGVSVPQSVGRFGLRFAAK